MVSEVIERNWTNKIINNEAKKVDIKFKDVNRGIVEARAIIELGNGVLLNEITIINREGRINVELPQKSFRGKDNKMHYIDILSFETENKRTLWTIEIKEEYFKWRKKNKKIEISDYTK